MTYAYGMKGAPAVGRGLGGLPRRAAAPAASEPSFNSEGPVLLAQNIIDRGVSYSPEYRGAFIFDRQAMQVRLCTAGRDGSLNWHSYISLMDLSPDGILSNHTRVGIGTSSSPPGGADGTRRINPSFSFKDGNGNIVFRNGNKFSRYNPTTHSFTSPFTIVTNGTFENGGTWTTTYNYADESGSSFFDEETRQFYVPTRGNTNNIMIQIFDEYGTFLGAWNTTVNTTNYARNRVRFQKTSWGFVLVAMHGGSSVNESKICVVTFDKDLTVLNVGSTPLVTVTHSIGTTSDGGGYDAYYDETANTVFVFMQEYVTGRSSISCIPFLLDNQYSPNASASAMETVTGVDFVSSQPDNFFQNPFLLPAYNLSWAEGQAVPESNIAAHIGKSRFFISHLEMQRNQKGNGNKNGIVNQIVSCEFNALRDETFEGMSQFVPSVKRLLFTQGNQIDIFKVADYGDYCFIWYANGSDSTALTRIDVIKR